jgi:hypothetical protein
MPSSKGQRLNVHNLRLGLVLLLAYIAAVTSAVPRASRSASVMTMWSVVTMWTVNIAEALERRRAGPSDPSWRG